MTPNWMEPLTESAEAYQILELGTQVEVNRFFELFVSLVRHICCHFIAVKII